MVLLLFEYEYSLCSWAQKTTDSRRQNDALPEYIYVPDKVYLGFGRGGGGIRFITGGASALGDLKVKINFNNPNPPVLTFWVLAVMSVETAAPVQTFPFSYLCTVS